MSDSIWTLQEVDRRVSVAIGNAIEKSRVKLELQDFKEANEIVLHSSQLSEQSMQRLKSAHNMALQSNGSVDMDALKRTCNRYERKLLSRIVDPSKLIK
jgi:hypothetical protein